MHQDASSQANSDGLNDSSVHFVLFYTDGFNDFIEQMLVSVKQNKSIAQQSAWNETICVLLRVKASKNYDKLELFPAISRVFKLFRKFNAKDFSMDTVKNSDRLKIYENFFECMRIQTNAGVCSRMESYSSDNSSSITKPYLIETSSSWTTEQKHRKQTQFNK